MTIIKRSGKTEKLTSKKIFDSICNANNAVDKEYQLTQRQIKRITESVVAYCEDLEEPIEIDVLEDVIEKKLMEAQGYEVAKRYITYRYEKERIRLNTSLTEKLTASNVQNQNANVDEFSFGGRIGETASFVAKQYALDHLISKKAVRNHVNNEIYIHDLDAVATGMHNCLSIPFDKLLSQGFTTRQTDVRPASSLNTAFQLVAVIFQIQSLQQFGGVSATHLDWTMVVPFRKSFLKHFKDGLKYIEKLTDDEVASFVDRLLNDPKEDNVNEITLANIWKDNVPSIEFKLYNEYKVAKQYALDKTLAELKQAVEGFFHNLNTLQSRSGNQLPFSSINYGTCTMPEGRYVIKAILEGTIDGVGKYHRTSIFPCGIFQCMKGVNRHKGDPNYDLFRLALKSCVMRIYPNFVNCDWTNDLGYNKLDPRTYPSTMGCRTFSSWDINAETPEFKHMKDGRGNICPVTIILPELAMQTKLKHQDDVGARVQAFMKLLDKKINEAKDMLLERFDWICSQPAKSARFMYENGTFFGYKPEEGIRSALKHGTLAIGQLGLAECLQILIGKDHTTEEGMKLAIEIETLYRDKCAKFKKEYKLNFGNYLTPAENLSHTSLKKFKDKYGVIKDVSDKEFFTNSIHVPVWKKLTPFEKIDIESKLTGFSAAGCISYVEIDSSAKNNIDAIEDFVNYAMDKDIPYLALNTKLDFCTKCGYQDEIGKTCPKCGAGEESIERLRRVTGYIATTYRYFNPGKQDEVQHRVEHTGLEA